MTNNNNLPIWLTNDSELHPETDCPSSEDWLGVFMMGTQKWIVCSKCGLVWDLVNNVPKIRESLLLSKKEHHEQRN